jgi:hypothetical protein
MKAASIVEYEQFAKLIRQALKATDTTGMTSDARIAHLEAERCRLLERVEHALAQALVQSGVAADVAALSAVQFVGHFAAWTLASR